MKATERFSNRVSNYLKYRPSYPLEVVARLTELCGLNDDSVIADIGSGTGKFSALLLAKNYQVLAVEPNKEMREAAEALFPDNQKFVSIAGESSATELANESIDLIVAAQAFHWFDPEPTKREFERILKPGGHIALIWNERDTDSVFQKEYDQMLSAHCPEYSKVNHRNISDIELQHFYHPKVVERFNFDYSQTFDQSGLLGRMFSSSYTPVQNSTEAELLSSAAEELFKKHETDGTVEFSYKTNLYISLR